MSAVSNSGPILSFGRADLLGLLATVLKEIHIPNAVYDEIVVHRAEVFWTPTWSFAAAASPQPRR